MQVVYMSGMIKVTVVYIRGEKGTWPLNIFIEKVVGIAKKGN